MGKGSGRERLEGSSFLYCFSLYLLLLPAFSWSFLLAKPTKVFRSLSVLLIHLTYSCTLVVVKKTKQINDMNEIHV